MTTVVLLGLAAGVVAFVLAPLLRADAAEAERVSAVVSEERDLASRREMLVATLRDLEDDRATGKVDEADYAELHARLSAEAVVVLRQIDAIDEARRTGGPVGVPAPPAPGSGPAT
jgi:hypothetical protein